MYFASFSLHGNWCFLFSQSGKDESIAMLSLQILVQRRVDCPLSFLSYESVICSPVVKHLKRKCILRVMTDYLLFRHIEYKLG